MLVASEDQRHLEMPPEGFSAVWSGLQYTFISKDRCVREESVRHKHLHTVWLSFCKRFTTDISCLQLNCDFGRIPLSVLEDLCFKIFCVDTLVFTFLAQSNNTQESDTSVVLGVKVELTRGDGNGKLMWDIFVCTHTFICQFLSLATPV